MAEDQRGVQLRPADGHRHAEAELRRRHQPLHRAQLQELRRSWSTRSTRCRCTCRTRPATSTPGSTSPTPAATRSTASSRCSGRGRATSQYQNPRDRHAGCTPTSSPTSAALPASRSSCAASPGSRCRRASRTRSLRTWWPTRSSTDLKVDDAFDKTSVFSLLDAFRTLNPDDQSALEMVTHAVEDRPEPERSVGALRRHGQPGVRGDHRAAAHLRQHARGPTPTPAEVRVRIVNASGRADLGAGVKQRLTELGFVVTDVGGEPEDARGRDHRALRDRAGGQGPPHAAVPRADPEPRHGRRGDPERRHRDRAGQDVLEHRRPGRRAPGDRRPPRRPSARRSRRRRSTCPTRRSRCRSRPPRSRAACPHRPRGPSADVARPRGSAFARFFTRFVIALVIAGAVVTAVVVTVNNTIDKEIARIPRVDVNTVPVARRRRQLPGRGLRQPRVRRLRRRGGRVRRPVPGDRASAPTR